MSSRLLSAASGLVRKGVTHSRGHAVIREGCQGREKATLSPGRDELAPYVGRKTQPTKEGGLGSPEWAELVIWVPAAMHSHP